MSAPVERLQVAHQDRRKEGGGSPRLLALLGLESAAISCANRRDLQFLAVTSTKSLITYDHAFFIVRKGKDWCFKAISSQSVIDENAPLLQRLKTILRVKNKRLDFHKPLNFSLAHKKRGLGHGIDYPFTEAFWAPFGPHPELGGILYTRAKPWSERETSLLVHLTAHYGCCWTALRPQRRWLQLPPKWRMGAAIALTLAIFFAPVTVTTLAPAEVMAYQPIIISAPIDGVLDTIKVPPNTIVQQGDVLATYVATSYRNEDQLAAGELAIAEAKLRQISLQSYVDDRTKQEIAIARAELDLARAKKSYTAEKLQKTDIRAPQNGLLIYTDQNDWAGRPVTTGERIMEIANPALTSLRVEAPVADSDILRDDARIRFFLDADPLTPLSARLVQASYQATPQAGGGLAYEALALFPKGTPPPRIGARGVAKIYGGKAPFGYWLLRRPIATLRQFFGL